MNPRISAALSRFSSVFLPVAAITASLHAGSAAALTWNWSYLTDDPTTFASGTFETSGSGPVAGLDYIITAATGVFTLEGTGYSINGLDSYFGLASQRFQWDGTVASPILSNYESAGGTYGISTWVPGLGIGVMMYNDSLTSPYLPINGIDTYTYGKNFYLITSSSLQPQAVPGPLPLLGAGAAFGWSRRLRHRLRSRV